MSDFIQKKPIIAEYPCQHDLVTKELVKVRSIDEDGNPHFSTEVRVLDGCLDGLDANNFEISTVLAAGATDLLKEMPMQSGSILKNVDAIDAHLSHVESININVNE